MPPDQLDPLAALAAYWRPVIDATLAEPQEQSPYSFSAHSQHAGNGGTGGPRAYKPAATTLTPQEQQELAALITQMSEERPQVDTNALDASYAKEQADTGPRHRLDPLGGL